MNGFHAVRKVQPLLTGRWYFWLLLVFILLPIGTSPQGASEGSTLRQVVLVMLFVGATFSIIRFPERWSLTLASIPPALFLLLLYAALSVIWSPQPYVSLKRVIQLVGVALVGLALTTGGAGTYRMHRLVMPVLWFGMMAAVIFTAAFPSFAFSEIGLRAYFGTKNNFGQFAAISVLFTAGALVTKKDGLRWPLWGLFILSLVGLGFSRSATAILALAAAGSLILAIRVKRVLHPSWWVPILTLLAVLMVAAIGTGIVLGFPSLAKVSDSTAALVGRDITLTGRAYLWELMLTEAATHPWFGTGYGGFWLGLEGRSGQVAYLVRWGYPGQAHNGYIDIYNELGLVGLALALAFITLHARSLWRLAAIDRPLAGLHLALFVLVVVFNLAEAAILRTTNMMWILLVVSSMEVAMLTRKPSAPAPARSGRWLART